jgi:magnesium-transporting ATPase (P-type)
MVSIKNIKTDYKRIVIASILLIAVTLLLYLIEIFGFWGIYGEGATASRISELWYVDLILNFSPIVLVGGFLIYKIWSSYKQEEYVKYKTYLITVLILIIVYALKGQIMKIVF